MSLINTKIKPFSSMAFKKGKFINISEKDIIGSWSVLFFYPADFTFVCPTELEDLSKNYDKFKSLKTEIYSISTDTHFSHKEWHNNSRMISSVQYTMISDSSWTLTKNFEVMQEYEENGVKKEKGLSERGTFILNKEGIIKSVEIISDNIGRSSIELIRKIKAIQYVDRNIGEVCPVNWEYGEDTLFPSIDLVGKL
ncbi:alkyl hydroperoxide reductase [Candidatus Riesia sp. GBBU]|nr:alkyl hydroperoxide reductase [Candidatus Riesia sp. GBBU]